MTAVTGVRETEDYLAAVGQELADLPAEDRGALLEDLALHLEALGAEDDDRPLTLRLGTPAAYAADLRAAAGLPPRTGVTTATSGVRDRLARMAAAPAVAEVRRLLRDLRPAWWVLRGYLVVLVPCQLTPDWMRHFPLPAPLGSHVLGLVLVAVAVVGSVALGRRSLPRPLGALLAVAGAVLALVSLAVWTADRRQAAAEAAAMMYAPPPEVAVGAYPLLSRYGPVTDVFPYAADGTPLDGVLLYDQDGRPLRVGFQEWWADGCVRVLEQPRAADGVPVPNSYPQAYELPEQQLDVYGNDMTAGPCVADPPRPDVPLPTFAAEAATD